MIRADWLLTLLTILTITRLTRLATTDFIFNRPRAWIQDHGGTHLAYLVQCPWCLSLWIAGAVTAAEHWTWTKWWWQAGMLALTASLLTGLFAQISDLIDATFTVTNEEAEDVSD